MAYVLVVIGFGAIVLRDEPLASNWAMVIAVAVVLLPVARRFGRVGTFRTAEGRLLVVNPLRSYVLGPGDIARLVPERPKWGPIRIELTDGSRVPIVHAPSPWSENRMALYAFTRGL